MPSRTEDQLLETRIKKYGITVDQYRIMLEVQSGLCAICRRLPTRSRKLLCVDHCHETGRVRGLLCSACNTAIGLLGDSRERLLAAADYLKP